jgi:DNA invertase Pin-like site-specific DNA recombinase
MGVLAVDRHPETQLHDPRQTAVQRAYEIVHEYTGRLSGVKARRPGRDQMLADARRGKLDVVMVWACGRIARSTRHFLEVLDALNRLQVEFISFCAARTAKATVPGPDPVLDKTASTCPFGM